MTKPPLSHGHGQLPAPLVEVNRPQSITIDTRPSPSATDDAGVDSPIAAASTRKRKRAFDHTDIAPILTEYIPPGDLLDRLLLAFSQESTLPSTPITSMTERTICREFGLTSEVDATFEDFHRYILPIPDINTLEGQASASQEKRFIGLPDGLLRFFKLYAHVAKRTSEAMCRTLVDVILIESICMLDGYTQKIASDGGGATGSSTANYEWNQHRSQYSSIKLFAEIGCEYDSGKKRYSGRLDYGIGIPLDSHPPFSASHPRSAYTSLSKPKLLSLLTIIEAKAYKSLDNARTQLMGYLGCLYAWRKRRGKHCPRVFGIATDGYVWQFLEVTDKGDVRESERVDLFKGGAQALERVVKAVMALLAIATEIVTPGTSPVKEAGDNKEEEIGDDILDVTGSGFLDVRPLVPTDPDEL